MKHVTVVLSIILILFLAGCASCLTDSLSSMPHKHKAMWCNSYDKDMRCCVWGRARVTGTVRLEERRPWP